jgi:hypothetical protein
MFESWRMKSAGPTARMGVTRNEYKIVVGNLRDINLFGEQSIGGRILLKSILKEEFLRV